MTREWKMDKKFDDKLLIKTRGIREWKMDTPYNRCESTPYAALEKLFEKYKLNKEDQLVDFGSGRGRVAFYIHNKFNIPITGVELHETTLDEALENKRSYKSKANHLDAPIKFEYGYAEDYEIKKEENKFYFFNPFQAVVFKKVVNNIIKSAKEAQKEVDIILYYPMPGYKKHLKYKTDFILIDKILLEGVNDKREKLLIYRLDPNAIKSKEENDKKTESKLVLKKRSANVE